MRGLRRWWGEKQRIKEWDKWIVSRCGVCTSENVTMDAEHLKFTKLEGSENQNEFYTASYMHSLNMILFEVDVAEIHAGYNGEEEMSSWEQHLK